MKGVTNLTIFIRSEASKELSTLSPPTLFLSGKLSEHKSVHKKVKRNRLEKAGFEVCHSNYRPLHKHFSSHEQPQATKYVASLQNNLPSIGVCVIIIVPKPLSNQFLITFNSRYYWLINMLYKP